MNLQSDCSKQELIQHRPNARQKISKDYTKVLQQKHNDMVINTLHCRAGSMINIDHFYNKDKVIIVPSTARSSYFKRIPVKFTSSSKERSSNSKFLNPMKDSCLTIDQLKRINYK